MDKVNKDVSERTIFEAHQKNIESIVSTENALARMKQKIEEKDKTLAEKDETIANLQQKKKELYAVNKDVSERTYFEAHRKYIESKVTTENALARAKQEIEEKDKTLAEKDKIIAELQKKNIELVCLKILENVLNTEFLEGMYSLDGYDEDAVCLKKEGAIWEVYVGSRGQKKELKIYDNIISACLGVIQLLTPQNEALRSKLDNLFANSIISDKIE